MIEQKIVRYPNLIAEIARWGDNYGKLSKLLGISVSAVARRLNGSVEWSKSEIDTLCGYYGKPYDYLFGA